MEKEYKCGYFVVYNLDCFDKCECCGGVKSHRFFDIFDGLNGNEITKDRFFHDKERMRNLVLNGYRSTYNEWNKAAKLNDDRLKEYDFRLKITQETSEAS